MSGSPRSSRTTSGWRAAASRSAVVPSGAASTPYWRACRLITRARTSCGSSSTTSTRVIGVRLSCRTSGQGAEPWNRLRGAGVGDRGVSPAADSRAVRVRPSALRHEFLERDVEFEDVDAGFADEAEGAAVGVVVDQLLAPGRRGGRSSRRPGGPGGRRTAGEMSGSRPEPEEVTASAGTSDGLDRVAGDRVVLDDGGLGVLDPLDQVRVVAGAVGGAGEDQLVLGVDAVGAEAVRRAALEPLQVGLRGLLALLQRQVVRLADERGADDLAVRLDLRAVRLVGEERPGRRR